MTNIIRVYLSNFSRRVKLEIWQTKEAGMIASKYIKHENVSVPERKFMLVQMTDVVKIIFIGIPFALIPGASLLLPVVINVSARAGINLLPSAFSTLKKDTKQNHTNPV